MEFNLEFSDKPKNFNLEFEADSEFNVELEDSTLVPCKDHRMLSHRDAEDQHPISAISGLEEKLSSITSDRTYVHHQRIASNLWNIVHNLNKYPSVTIVDSANNIVIGDVNYINKNEVSIEFIGTFSGKAFLN